jgi:hypothetical protein
MQQPPISLENLTGAEKEQIVQAAQKNLVRGIGIFLVPFFIMVFVLFYLNNHWMSLGMENGDLRGYLNVALVLVTVFPARLFVNTIVRFRKSQSAWQKKIFRGKISSKNGRVIVIANQKVKLTPELAEKINAGDEAIVAINHSDNYPLYVEKISKPVES